MYKKLFFFSNDRTALGQPSLLFITHEELFVGWKSGEDLKLITHFCLALMSKMLHYNSTPPYVLMAWCLIKHRKKDNFNVYLVCVCYKYILLCFIWEIWHTFFITIYFSICNPESSKISRGFTQHITLD
jgi:hypothetical protein